jgi:hypothetical protein
MDFIDRFQLYIRYSLLAILALLGKTETVYFNNQLRKVDHVLNINDELDEEIQSEESSACGVAEDAFQCIGHDEDEQSVGNGEGVEESGSEGVVEQQPNGDRSL